MAPLQELQEIVEQIDMATTFAKIGGFGRLIALVALSCLLYTSDAADE